MKTLISAVVVAAALVAPVASFAQSTNQPLTRAEVRAQLVQLEKAGYNPIGDHTDYPSNLLAAQARVDAQNGNAQAANSGYGAPAVGTSQSGRSVSSTDRNSVYFGN
ncbi:protein of unknown function [Paraburkholderia fungorum]|uniref:DUF4148 domain-containing protein n=1 Tax=Paraburkholderia fungorum TaxID=134537 RepID=A0A1H1HFZ5_9BURK|nr:DUF4148 domain-containing protein [Paraburkholderia fungorum]SDR23966.1 protein of unknown function [Paraburkholderia fungorum]